MTASPRILIVRLSALGDVVMASGLIPALRVRHPDAHLAWLTEPAAAPLLRHNPRLDELLVWDRPTWKAWWKAGNYAQLRRTSRIFRASLRERRFDLVLDVQGLLKSGLCAWWSRAPRRVALHPREGSQWLATESLQHSPGPHPLIGSEYRQLAQYLGAPAQAFHLDIAIGQEPAQAAERALRAAGIEGPYTVLAPFTTRPQKHWFEDRWAQLAARWRVQGLRCVVLGGPGDLEAASRICRGSPHIVNLAGQLPLDVSAAVIEKAALLVGVDTGLTHLGSALRVPTLALFGSTCPYADAGVPSTRILYHQLPCSPCHRHPTCGGRFDCMRAHTVDDVFHAGREVLELSR